MGENTPLDRLEVRPIRAEEVSLWGEYLKRYHYLGYKSIPGKSLRYIATIEKEWVALIGWGSPALKCSVRDRLIGWDYERKLNWSKKLPCNRRLGLRNIQRQLKAVWEQTGEGAE